MKAEMFGPHQFVKYSDGTFYCSHCTLPGPPDTGNTPLTCAANPIQGKLPQNSSHHKLSICCFPCCAVLCAGFCS